jgi:PAS domain-containing protein
VIALVALLFAGVFAARWAVEGDTSGLTFLYVLPIAIAGVEFGRRAGVAAGVLAVALFAVWFETGDHAPDNLAYLTRAVVFVGTGWLTGFLGHRVRDASSRAERLARHFELSHDMLCTATFDGYFVELNRAWEETLGWTREELMSRPSSSSSTRTTAGAPSSETRPLRAACARRSDSRTATARRTGAGTGSTGPPASIPRRA